MADLAVAEKSKSELVTMIERGRKRDRLVRLAEKAKRLPHTLFGTIVSTAGGAGAGVLTAKYPSLYGSVISGSDVAAALAIGAGIVTSGELAEQSIRLGQGLLAGDVAIRTHQAWLKK